MAQHAPVFVDVVGQDREVALVRDLPVPGRVGFLGPPVQRALGEGVVHVPPVGHGVGPKGLQRVPPPGRPLGRALLRKPLGQRVVLVAGVGQGENHVAPQVPLGVVGGRQQVQDLVQVAGLGVVQGQQRQRVLRQDQLVLGHARLPQGPVLDLQGDRVAGPAVEGRDQGRAVVVPGLEAQRRLGHEVVPLGHHLLGVLEHHHRGKIGGGFRVGGPLRPGLERQLQDRPYLIGLALALAGPQEQHRHRGGPRVEAVPDVAHRPHFGKDAADRGVVPQRAQQELFVGAGDPHARDQQVEPVLEPGRVALARGGAPHGRLFHDAEHGQLGLVPAFGRGLGREHQVVPQLLHDAARDAVQLQLAQAGVGAVDDDVVVEHDPRLGVGVGPLALGEVGLGPGQADLLEMLKEVRDAGGGQEIGNPLPLVDDVGPLVALPRDVLGDLPTKSVQPPHCGVLAPHLRLSSALMGQDTCFFGRGGCGPPICQKSCVRHVGVDISRPM